ncbi:uncharacterized protein [Pyrus communis]|uniref:uncharacterized protein n=1 Tax=Pyrus communis TaxID=23211 RepID=UPI0035BEC260
MAYQMHTDEERCLLFPSILSSEALNWYCRLTPETVYSFEELRKLFVSQHIFQTDRLHSADDLYTILQKLDESLREYIGRFSHEYSHCAEADNKTTLKVFTTGLRECFFKYMINANTWKTYFEVMAQAYNHASAEARTYQGKPHMAIPYQQVGNESQIQPSEKTSTFQMTLHLPLLYLVHYQDNRHINLRSMGHYHDNQGYRYDNARPQAVNAVDQLHVKTNPISSSGTPLSECSNKAMKNSERTLRSSHQVFHVEDISGAKYQKPNWDPICFYPEEERGIVYPHSDSLIVKAHITNFDVRWILVDTGASINIMFAEAFRALNVAEHLLDPSVTPLINFSGDIVQPLGNIHLPFTISTGPYTTTITTNFLVVDCPTAYNVIFGRIGINYLKAMVSTHMLLMKFPTPSGNGYIRRDQLSA